MENVFYDLVFILLLALAGTAVIVAMTGTACSTQSSSEVTRNAKARIREHGKRAREEMDQASEEYLQQVSQRARKVS